MKKHWIPLVLLALSLLVHFLYFGHPQETVFDEVHFGKYISGYFTHEYFFDIHPPLGKLFISGMGYLTGFEPGFSFEQIGQEFTDNSYLWLRLLPMLAGILLPLVLYFLLRELGFSRKLSALGGLLAVFENALLVQSRFILLDSFLLLFGFTAFWAYFRYRNSGRLKHLVLTGILGALAMSIKWTGATFLFIPFIMELVPLIRRQKRDLLRFLISLVAVPFVVYFLVFAVHLGLLSQSGTGNAYMTPEFQKTLEGNAYRDREDIRPLNFFQKFTELNMQMYTSNATLTARHPYGSLWYTWPFMVRPIFYWSGEGDLAGSRIYLLGNPVVWWAGAFAVMYLLILFLVARNILPEGRRGVAYLLIGGFFLNLLPFMGISRIMFLYHYFPALVFSILAIVYMLSMMEKKRAAGAALLILSIASFAYFAPLSYGLKLSSEAYNARAILPSWR